MVLSSQAFAFHRVRGLVFENPQPQPQAESYVKLFFEADGMHGVGGNPAGAPNAGVFAHEVLGYRRGSLDEIECASGTARSSQSGITHDRGSIKAFAQGDVRGVVGGDVGGDGLAQLPHPSQRGASGIRRRGNPAGCSGARGTGAAHGRVTPATRASRQPPAVRYCLGCYRRTNLS